MADSGFWIALSDARDQYHDAAITLPVDLDALTVIVPWPSLYETFSTRSARDARPIAVLSARLRRRNIQLLSDIPYRDMAFEQASSSGPSPLAH